MTGETGALGGYVGAALGTVRLWHGPSLGRLRPLRPLLLTMEITFQKLDTELPAATRPCRRCRNRPIRPDRRCPSARRARAAVPFGIVVAIPDGFAGLVLPRSGLALRHGVGVVSAPVSSTRLPGRGPGLAGQPWIGSGGAATG